MDEDDPLILVLYNDETEIINDELRNLIAVQDTANVAMQIIEALTFRGWQTKPIPVKSSLEELVESLKPFSPRSAFVFNFCDGFNGNNKDAALVLKQIERLGFSHTGSSAKTTAVCIDKHSTKVILRKNGVRTPESQLFQQPVKSFFIPLPAIVKPSWDDASIGIDCHSVVSTKEELSSRVEMILETYHQPALVEEFIPGREFSVSIWGNKNPIILPITEMDYSHIENPLHRILSYESKWEPESYFYQNIHSRCPANLHGIDKQRVVEAATRVYRVMGIRDFGRVDIRYHNNIPYVIDVNEIPDLGKGSGFPNSALQAGFDHPSMIDQILRFAIERERWLKTQMTLNLSSHQKNMNRASWRQPTA